ncbi:hypothetical protein Tco_0400239 [Tanacetum coccineum]
MVGSSIYTVTSVLTQRELDQHCLVFNIPAELRPELPGRNSTIKDSPEGKICMYTRFIEFANYRVSLSKFLLCILEYYQIHLSQLSVIGAAKMVVFFQAGGAADPCCYSKKFDSLKNWNNRFFWIDASVFPFSTSWFSGTSVVKDPLPMDEAVDLPCVELLNENRTLIRKYPETFLCLVGLSRSFTDIDVRPTLLHDNDEEMGMLDFVKSVDPFKVKVGERTLAENEVLLITETENRVISPSTQTISLVDHNIQDELNVNSGKRKKRVAFVSGSPPVKKAWAEGIVISEARPSTAGKSPTALRRLIRQSEQAAAGSGSAAAATEDITSSSVTLTLEHVFEDALHDNVRTRPPTGHFVVLSSSSADTDILAASQVAPRVSSQVGVSVPTTESAGDGHPASAPKFETGTLSATPSHGSSADYFYESQTIDFATAMNVYVPNWNVTNNGQLDDPVICRSLLDNVTPPSYWSALRNQSDRDTKIAELKVKLEKSKSEAAEAEELRKRVSDLEALVPVRSCEVTNLTTQNAGLLKRVSAMDSECDSLKSQVVGKGMMREEFVMQQDAAEWRFEERAAELNTCIANVRRDMDNDLYPHMLTVIDGRRWVVRHDFRLAVYKCARSVECCSALGKVISMAINKEVEGKYVAAVSEFEGVSFPLLDELESLKDSPLVQIMVALILKDDQGNRDAALEFAWFQTSVNQVYVPIYSESGSIEREMLLSDTILAICQSTERRGLCLPSSSTLGEASGFDPPVTSLGVTDY